MISYEIAQYLQGATILVILLLSFITWQKWQTCNARQIIYGDNTWVGTLIIVLAGYALIIGCRPPSGKLFGDTANYAYVFKLLQTQPLDLQFSGEWLFSLFSWYSAHHLSVHTYFTIIAFGYIFFSFFGLYRMFRNNTWGAMLFLMGAFSFFSYGTNGIRNGLACAIMIFAMSFIVLKRRNYLIFALFAYLAFVIHKSTALPTVCLIAALFIRNPKPLIPLWFLAIFLSVVARGPIDSFFSSLGFDDRLTDYIQISDEYIEQGNTAGFRPDFLLYSFMPIWLGLKVIGRVGTSNRTYCMLLSTYILANSCWVMLMNAAYSNRFAYLSWFMYPIVLAYPCLKMNVWGNRQGAMAGTILLMHSAFTTFMHFVYY